MHKTFKFPSLNTTTVKKKKKFLSLSLSLLFDFFSIVTRTSLFSYTMMIYGVVVMYNAYIYITTYEVSGFELRSSRRWIELSKRRHFHQLPVKKLLPVRLYQLDLNRHVPVLAYFLHLFAMSSETEVEPKASGRNCCRCL
jgi:hypothetical protein